VQIVEIISRGEIIFPKDHVIDDDDPSNNKANVFDNLYKYDLKHQNTHILKGHHRGQSGSAGHNRTCAHSTVDRNFGRFGWHFTVVGFGSGSLEGIL